MSKFLLICNEAPYGGERSYNGLRLVRQLMKTEGVEARIFLMGDAVIAAKAGQKVPQGYYNAADMLSMVHRAGALIAACGTCMDARGLTDTELVEAVTRGSMDLLAAWTRDADKVLVF